MNKHILIGFISGLIAASAQATPGEYWEITTKMEMAGMPFAMPMITAKVCVPSGGEKNPQYMQKKDDTCQMTDVKMSGNKVTWKARCTTNGETMNGTGESSHERDSYRGSMHLTGHSGGQAIDMTQNYNGKRIGGSCDSEAQIKALTGKMCDTSQLNSGTEWISRADMFLKGDTCPGKKEQLCSIVRKDAVRDIETFQMLVTMEKNNGGLIASSCGIRMEETRAAVCKANREGNYEFLQTYCPAEAKEYKEQVRRKSCAGRGYSSVKAVDDCISGGGSADDEASVVHETSARKNMKKARGYADKSDNDNNDAASNTDTDTGNATTNSILEGAKKLKGIFSF
ncbi:MAG TPA: DUF3617 family protein [Rhodocyclaceae bacterium]|nr:DUF3617 family protein [Rhodocyclaceae bacterium]